MAERGHRAFTRGHHRWVLWPPKTLSAANKGIDKLFIGQLFPVVEDLARGACCSGLSRNSSCIGLQN